MCTELNNPHDFRLKELFENRKAFLSLLQDYIKGEWADKIDVNSLKSLNTEQRKQVSGLVREQNDLLYEAETLDGKIKIYFYILFEIQTESDFTMPFRLFDYLHGVLYKAFEKASDSEKKRKSFKLPVVVPIVFYRKSRAWNAPLNFREYFANYEFFGDYVLNFRYELVAVKDMTDDDIIALKSKLLQIMLKFEKCKNEAELRETVKNYSKEILSLEEAEQHVIDRALKTFDGIYNLEKTETLIETLKTAVAERIEQPMLSDFMETHEQLIESIEKANSQKIAVNLFKMNLNTEQVTKATSLPLAEVERIKAELKL